MRKQIRAGHDCPVDRQVAGVIASDVCAGGGAPVGGGRRINYMPGKNARVAGGADGDAASGIIASGNSGGIGHACGGRNA